MQKFNISNEHFKIHHDISYCAFSNTLAMQLQNYSGCISVVFPCCVFSYGSLGKPSIKKKRIFGKKIQKRGGGSDGIHKTYFFLQKPKMHFYELLIAFSRFRGGFVNLPFTLKFLFFLHRK